MRRPYYWTIITATCILLLIASSRILRLNELGMNPDEISSVLQTFGTPSQIIQWTQYDGSPGYFLTLGAWRIFVGQHPIVLRYLSVLSLLIGSSFLFLIMRRLGSMRAALIVMLAYAAQGYGIFLSTEVHGYTLLIGLLPFALWLTIRYFDYPTTWRAFKLSLLLASLFYISFTSISAFLLLWIYTLAVYRKQVWRWWLPGLIAGIMTLPEIVSKARNSISQTEIFTLTQPSTQESLLNMYRDLVGHDYFFLIWCILFIVATTFIIYHRSTNRPIIALFLWSVGVPILMYFLNLLLVGFSVHYAWWIMIGIALWVAWGLSYIVNKGFLAIMILLSAMMFVFIPMKEYTTYEILSPLQSNLIWLTDHMITGDIFVADPNVECGSPEEWDYLARLYFPLGLTFVEKPGVYRRVWYVTATGQQDVSIQQSVTNGRVPGEFVGPPECLFRLYEAPPDLVGILFENGMRFHGADVIQDNRPWTGSLVRHEGESILLRLWWSVDRTPLQDYGVGLYVMRAKSDELFAETNLLPQTTYPEQGLFKTSLWKSGSYYVEERELILSFPTPKIAYRIALAIYRTPDGDRISALGVNENKLLTLMPLTVMAY